MFHDPALSLNKNPAQNGLTHYRIDAGEARGIYLSRKCVFAGNASNVWQWLSTLAGGGLI